MVLDENKMAPVSEEPVFDSSSIAQARGRIRRTLEYSLKENYGIEDKEIVDKFMKMHGVSDKHFDFINNFENLVEMGSADASIDSNSNKSDVSIAGLLNEVSLPINKVVGYRYLYRKMKQMYGKKRAKYLAGRMYDMSLALADSTNILRPYCYAINAQKLVMEGRNWGTAPSLPPKRVASYISALNESVHQLASHLAGAIAIGSFFFDIAHVMLFREGKGLKDITEDETYRKYIENCLQSFVHSMNSLSRNATESPFTNISIFDTVKLRAMIGDMAWYFDYYDLNEKLSSEATEEGMIDYVIKIIVEIQELYCGIMDRGVVYDGGRPFTFPVSTFNFSRGKREDGTYYIEDEKFLHNFCENHDVVRYNIYCSEGQKISSCCRLINDIDLFELGGQVNSFGGTGLSLGSHRVCTINLRRISLECSDFDDYLARLKVRMEECVDILCAHRELMKDLIDRGCQPFMKNGWLDLNRMFSTVGIMGYYEAVEDFKKKYGTDRDYLKEILVFINEYALTLTKERKVAINIEEIPGESMSYKLANCDRWLFGEDRVPEGLYSNQFLPNYGETAKCTLDEKIKAESIGRYLTGGGICHLNVNDPVTPMQAELLISKALQHGLDHFAINCVYSICGDEHWTLGKNNICPVCGKPVVDYATRVVGFFTKVNSNWAKPKREYDFNGRYYHNSNDFFHD